MSVVTPSDGTRDEMWVYHTILLLMGIVGRPEINLNWTNDQLCSILIFSQLMPRTRFKVLRIMIHFSSPTDFEPDDPLKKLRTFLDDLSGKFRDNYIPSENIAVDEYLSLWKGRPSFRIYIPTKRERYGIKLCMVCESSTAYVSLFIIYTEQSTDYPAPNNKALLKEWDEYSKASKIVLFLADQFLNLGYWVTLDNYYTVPELAAEFYHLNTDCIGTYKKSLPGDFW